MVELIKEYLKEIPYLTISNEVRQQIELEQKEKQISELQIKDERISKLEETMNLLKEIASNGPHASLLDDTPHLGDITGTELSEKIKSIYKEYKE
jgi:hypothetical protein